MTTYTVTASVVVEATSPASAIAAAKVSSGGLPTWHAVAADDDHHWPPGEAHLWGPWHARTGLPNPIQYRTCQHPLCNEVQNREGAK